MLHFQNLDSKQRERVNQRRGGRHRDGEATLGFDVFVAAPMHKISEGLTWLQFRKKTRTRIARSSCWSKQEQRRHNQSCASLRHVVRETQSVSADFHLDAPAAAGPIFPSY